VGIPAGIAKFDYLKFSIFTLIGAAIWCSVLCWVGVTVGTEAIKGEMHKVMALVGGIALILGALYYFFVHRHMSKVPDAKRPK
jgi:membrane protein DedA with SNARE-associated domain